MQKKEPCWNCQKPLEEDFILKDGRKNIPFRALCPHCQSYLHVCKNCQFYQKGLPHDCQKPSIEPVLNKELQNFCEEFSPLLSKKQEKNLNQIEQELFGNSNSLPPKDPKKAFNDLFKD